MTYKREDIVTVVLGKLGLNGKKLLFLLLLLLLLQ